MGKWYKILVAVDAMESSMTAVHYVGKVAGGIHGVSISLLHVYPEPPPDFYVKGGILEHYQDKRTSRAERVFHHCTEILISAGIDKKAICSTIQMAEGKTISETLLEVCRKGDFGTVVTGKRGVSKAEEFLFGSISNALARHCQDFTAWIVG